jgi:hypothetical protein
MVIDDPDILFTKGDPQSYPGSWGCFMRPNLCQPIPNNPKFHKRLKEYGITLTLSEIHNLLMPGEEYLEWVFLNDIQMLVYLGWSDGCSILFKRNQDIALSKLTWDECNLGYARYPSQDESKEQLTF